MPQLSVVGQSVTRLDALEKVTGKAKYASDLRVPGMLHGKILRSPHPHARILSIDTSRAKELGGVRAVVTAKEAPEKAWGMYILDRYMFARDVVRFVGEPVAAVAADTVEIAEEAVDLIQVDYQPMPAIFDAEEALSPNPPVVVHPDLFKYERITLRPNDTPAQLEPALPNVCNHFKIRKGDVEQGFREADLVVENRFSTARVQHCPMEPHIAVAQVETDGGLTVTASTQGIYVVKGVLCRLFGMSPAKVRVVAFYVGGGFGGKVWVTPEPYAALLAMRTGKAVRLALTRDEVFLDGGCRNPMIIYVKDGVKNDGRIIAREVRIVLNSGAYGTFGGRLARNAAFGVVGSYHLPNLKLDSYGVYTNEPVAMPFRGFACPESLWAIESQMDIIAEKLGIDPVEIRKMNLLKEGQVNACGETVHSIGAKECLERAARFIEWGKKPQQQEREPWTRGKGIALGNKYTAATATSIIVKVHEDGTIEVRHSAVELGQGCDTVLAQIAAEEFGVGMDRVKLVCRDTAITPYDFATSSSRVTFHGGNAVRLACQDAKRELFERAASPLEAHPEDLETKDGKICRKGSPEPAIEISQLFLRGGIPPRGEIIGTDTYSCPVTVEDPETGQGERLVAFYAHGAHGVEVAVNKETGEVKITRIAGAFDMGQPINPKLCEAQIEGGIGMGIGIALYEEVVTDGGTVVNPTFMDYKIPTVLDMPTGKEVGAIVVGSTPHQEGPFGAKGLGEGVLAPLAPAVANAVYNAVGVRVKDLPITRQRLLKALQDKARAGPNR